jgi:hypothetical protein
LHFEVESAVYLTPTIKAYEFNHPDKTSILILNICLGWLFIPWVIALVWAYKKNTVVTLKAINHDIEDRKFTEAVKKCPFCAELIMQEAIKCKHCGSEIPATTVV